MKALEIACRRCAAQPGEPCTVTDVRGVTIRSVCATHAERIEDAAAMPAATTGAAVSEAALVRAVERSGRLF